MSLPESVVEETPSVDEDVWIVPSAWWRPAEPFRGRGPRRTVTVDPDAPAVVAELFALAGERFARTLDRPDSDAELVRGARLYLGTPTRLLRRARQEIHPQGAAVVGAILAAMVDHIHRAKLGAIVDDWIGRYGVGFAAEAAVLLADIRVYNPTYPRAYGSSVELIVAPAPANDIAPYHVEPVLARLREVLAAADDATYDDAVRRLAAHRSGPIARRVAATYLVPTEPRWLDDDLAFVRSAGITSHGLMPLLASATTAAQAIAVVDVAGPTAAPAGRLELVYSLVAHVGPDVAPVLARFLDHSLDATDKKRLLSVLGQLPNDTAFAALLDRLDRKYVQPVVLEAMARFPRRALRLLAAAAAGSGARAGPARQLLHDHAISHPDLVGRTLPVLAPDAAGALDAVAADTDRVPVAPADRLPSLLVTPPWTIRRARAKPVVVEPAGPPSPTTLTWKPGEQAEWTETDVGFYRQTADWPVLVSAAVSGGHWGQLRTLALAPDELVRPLLRRTKPIVSWDADVVLRRILGRFGDDALDFVVRAAFARPTNVAQVLLPIEGSEIAIRMAEWHGRSKTIRPVAARWFERHGAPAARDLVPVALAKPGKNRTMAEAALRLIERLGHRDAIRIAADAQGPVAVDVIDDMLAIDPLHVLPARIPALPAWLDAAHLPQVLVLDGSDALPQSAVEHICTMFAISEPGATYAGIDVVRQAVDAAALAEMAWGVFERWRAAGFPAKEGWVLNALGVVGDDETVRRLTPLIKVWPGESAHRRAVAALDVLTAIGTDVALMHLHGIAEKAKARALRNEAKQRIDGVADGLGLTADELADRLVPDFGLDDGSLVLDYGDRRFRIGFDEQLKPTVVDQDGARRKLLPKPGVRDDPVLAPAAYAHFQGLKKDVKTIAADQIRRFERAMVTGRRWAAAEQRTLFIEHPLLWHLARRLVWTTFDPSGAADPDGAFRVAEDRTLADRADEQLVVDDDAVVGVAHPLHLGATVPDWSEVFADYEILQPFPQLGREVFRLTDAERNAHVLDRFQGMKVPTGKILGLSYRGWERGAPQDAGIQSSVSKPFPGGLVVVIGLAPGIVAGEVMMWPEQTIAGIELNAGGEGRAGADGHPRFGRFDPITASELLRDLEGLLQ